MNDKIKYIVYVMFENRSFDHLLGWLYETGEKFNAIPAPAPGTKPPPFNGLNTGRYFNLNKNNDKVYASRITPSDGYVIPDVDPNEPFEHVQVQIANNMGGFIRDFSSATDNPEQIMECYPYSTLPVINGLAKTYAVSDAYYSSIPTQTNCNRAFSLTGNSIGYYHYFGDTKVAMVDNYWTKLDGGPGMPYEFTERTVWNVLIDNGHDSPKDDWAVFHSQTWPGVYPYEGNYCFTQDLLWPSLKSKTNHFKDISEFFALAQKGGLPKFSFLEPTWYEEYDGLGHPGSDYHPPGNVIPGEIFLLKIYAALKSSPAWENTLLIVNFDEHGGTYDHVEPPATVAPWKNPDDGTAKPELSPKHPFDFRTLGVRVPLLLVSPLIEPNTVFRPEETAVYDHCSVIATILKYFDISRDKWGLGSRTVQAATFENVITGTAIIPRDDGFDELEEALSRLSVVSGAENIEVNELQEMIAHRYVWRCWQQMANDACSEDAFHQLCKEHFANVITMADLNNAIKTVKARMGNSGKGDEDK